MLANIVLGVGQNALAGVADRLLQSDQRLAGMAIGDALGGFVKGLRRGMTEDERIKVRPAERKDK